MFINQIGPGKVCGKSLKYIQGGQCIDKLIVLLSLNIMWSRVETSWSADHKSVNNVRI